ncbi:hypothetical protein FRC03_004430 [Tulasnella sp. 419]|nr:hypothetical protein FRC03_004430 [Tulasnella sp. 419]
MSLALRLRTPLAGGISTSSTVFSGHNRWSKISKGKGVQDAKKSQLYSRHMTDIIGAARRGGSTDPANNLALSIALRKAKMADVPKDKIEAALTRASSTSTEDALHSSVFEAIGPGSVPMIIECLSNNVNRTSKAVKEILNDRGYDSRS